MPKIVTCCYCGTRAALVLDEGRHELVCASCGAPLSQIEELQQPSATQPATVAPVAAIEMPSKKDKKKKRKKKKSRLSRILSEVVDEIEDIFD